MTGSSHIPHPTSHVPRPTSHIAPSHVLPSYHPLQVARVTGSFHIAPASKATGSQLGMLLVPHRVQPDQVRYLVITLTLTRSGAST